MTSVSDCHHGGFFSFRLVSDNAADIPSNFFLVLQEKNGCIFFCSPPSPIVFWFFCAQLNVWKETNSHSGLLCVYTDRVVGWVCAFLSVTTTTHKSCNNPAECSQTLSSLLTDSRQSTCSFSLSFFSIICVCERGKIESLTKKRGKREALPLAAHYRTSKLQGFWPSLFLTFDYTLRSSSSSFSATSQLFYRQ